MKNIIPIITLNQSVESLAMMVVAELRAALMLNDEPRSTIMVASVTPTLPGRVDTMPNIWDTEKMKTDLAASALMPIATAEK